jgi:hypothetical protein
MERYAYEPLNPTNGIICLANLSSVDEDTMQIHFQAYPISAAPKAIALSYEWGPPGDTKEIIIDDRLLSVRQNLWNALKSLWGSRADISRNIISSRPMPKAVGSINVLSSIF